MFTILYQRKLTKIQWLQDPNQSNIDNLNNMRREAIRQVWKKKKKEYQKVKIDELERSKVSQICIGLSVILRRVNGLKLI